jgi:hypothetical protein
VDRMQLARMPANTELAFAAVAHRLRGRHIGKSGLGMYLQSPMGSLRAWGNMQIGRMMRYSIRMVEVPWS